MIQSMSKKIDQRRLEDIRVDPKNMYANKKIGDLPEHMKKGFITIMDNMRQIREQVDLLKKQN